MEKSFEKQKSDLQRIGNKILKKVGEIQKLADDWQKELENTSAKISQDIHEDADLTEMYEEIQGSIEEIGF